MRLTGAFITLCALVACGEGRQASLATPMLSYNGSNPFPAVIGESMALTPPVSGTIGHFSTDRTCPARTLLFRHGFPVTQIFVSIVRK